MGNLVNLPNISLESEFNEAKQSKQNKNESAFDTKNYLDVMLDEENGETQKELTIRLLPMDLETGNPFVKVHFHNVKVPKEVSKFGYKSYMCLSNKNVDIDHEKYGSKCPFCELNSSAYKASVEEKDPVKKKMLQDISLGNISKESVIVRCIERGKENEGVKFWKFNIRADKKDPYNQIISLYTMLKKKSEDKAKSKNGGVLPDDFVPENILDIYNGRDLTITFNAGRPVPAPTIVQDTDRSPLSENEEEMKKWIYDKKKWQEVFTPKTYEFLSLISEQKVPWFDKANNIWVDKEEFNKNREFAKKNYENSVSEAESAITGSTQSVDITNMIINDDDLPY